MLLAALLALHLQPVIPNTPNRQPQLAASGATVALVFGSADSIWLAQSKDNGRTFGAPAKVADLPKVMLGRHRGPRVAIAGNTILVSAIQAEAGAPAHAGHAPATAAAHPATPAPSGGGDLHVWRSTDGGRTWSKPAIVNDKPASAREGLNALAADALGHVAAAWLDDRIAGGKRLWAAFSNDAGATWSKNAMLYESPAGTICECCHPSLLALGNGDFAVMWRNKLEGSRDFYVMRLHDGKPAGEPVKQGVGTWKLEACPMDGGGIALRNGEIVTAWRREHDIYLAHPGKPEVKLGPGEDVALAANAKGEFVIWRSGKAIEALAPGAAAPARLSEAGAFPSIVALPDGAMLAAWEENGTIATRRIE